jgi:tetratricopeptide (TPR) repeat protein
MRRRTVFAIVAALAATACAAPQRQHTLGVQQAIAARSWDAAIAALDQAKDGQYGQRNVVLYWLDKGAVLHDAGRFKESDAVLDLAERRMEELYTRSISKAAATFLVNEGTEDYAGQVHERTLLHVLRALNYAYLREEDEAAVEARKVTAFLTELNDRLGDKPLAYRDDAFAQYLSALLFEDQGRPDDARICYDASRAAYGWYASAFGVMPPPLPFAPQGGALAAAPSSAPAAAPAAAFASAPGAALSPAAAEAPAVPAPPEPAIAPAPAPVASAPAPAPAQDAIVPASLSVPGATPVPPPFAPAAPVGPPSTDAPGELVFLHYNGPGPRRETATLQIAWNKALIVLQASKEGRENPQVKNALVAGIAGNAVTFAYPVFVQDPYAIRDSEVLVDGVAVRTVLVEDVTAIARSTLAAALPSIQAKAIVRAMVKFLIARVAEQEAKKRLGDGWGALAGIAARVTAAATEVADTRAWTTLPSQFRLARIPLRPGVHAVRIHYLDAAGNLAADELLEGVEIRPGRRTYLHVRTGM